MKKFFLAFLVLVGMLYAKVDINTASVAELQKLKGVGDKKAQAIVDYRAKNGAFKSVEDLKNVPGIGPKIVSDNKKELEASTSIKDKATKETKEVKEAVKSGDTKALESKATAAKENATAAKSKVDEAKGMLKSLK